MHEDLGFGEMPEGWSNQLDNDVLVNLNRLRGPTGVRNRARPGLSESTGPQVVQRSWRPYFNVLARVRFVDEFVATEGGETQNGGYYSPVVSTPGDRQLIAGVHVAKIPLAFHLT